MTAATSTQRAGTEASRNLGILPGFGALFGKELKEWRRGRRTWVVLIVSALFMTLSALNAWLQANFLPTDGSEGVPNPVTDPMVILSNSVGTQLFSIAAIFAVMGLLVAERETGTLAWTASKPVSRSAIWLAKFTSASVVLWVVAGLIPLAATVVLVVALYGSLPLMPIPILALGIGMSIGLYVAIALAASTLVTSPAAVAAIALGAMFAPQLLGLFVPAEFLPGSILQWSLMAAAGASVPLVTPFVWLASMAALIIAGLVRMERLEL